MLNTFNPGDNILASEVNENFTYLRNKMLFGGDGSDGDFDSNGSNVTWDANGNEVIEKHLTSFTLQSGDILDVTNINTNGCTLYLKVDGDVTISGEINLNYKGGAGGSGSGSNGNSGFTMVSAGYTGPGRGGPTNGDDSGGGGGGASLQNNGADAPEDNGYITPGGDRCYPNFSPETISFGNIKPVAVGAGGGAGGYHSGYGDGYAGGGGAGGVFIAIANTIDTNTGTINNGGGAGGANDSSLSDGASGDGGNGAGGIIIECTGKLIFDGTINLQGEDGGDGGSGVGGGAGANGSSYIVENKGFV